MVCGIKVGLWWSNDEGMKRICLRIFNIFSFLLNLKLGDSACSILYDRMLSMNILYIISNFFQNFSNFYRIQKVLVFYTVHIMQITRRNLQNKTINSFAQKSSKRRLKCRKSSILPH